MVNAINTEGRPGEAGQNQGELDDEWKHRMQEGYQQRANVYGEDAISEHADGLKEGTSLASNFTLSLPAIRRSR